MSKLDFSLCDTVFLVDHPKTNDTFSKIENNRTSIFTLPWKRSFGSHKTTSFERLITSHI